jgi:hypothetical protein
MTRPCAVLILIFAASSALAQTWACESPNGTYRECRIATSGVVKLVYEMSDRACFEGVTWGTREPGKVWVDRGCRATFTADNSGANKRVVCESQNGERQICPVEPVPDVALYQQVSKAACIEFETWGFNAERNQLWVDQGCRGEFVLGKQSGPMRAALPKAQVLEGSALCESLDGQKRVCAADTSAGVQIIRNLSDAACRFGKEWSYNDEAIWVTKGCRAEFAIKGTKPKVQAIACESKNNARVICAGDTRFGVALVREYGNNYCTLGTSWGFDGQGVWVADGCRAQFALGGYRLPAGAVPATAARLRCESEEGKRTQCSINTTRGVGLIKQTSDAECVLNRSWGYDRDGIWVTNGCKAEFAVAR